MKRAFDIIISLFGLAAGSIVILPTMLAVWLQDLHSPFYIAERVGRGGQPFRMVKLRSMRILADTTGVVSTAGDDPRITKVGRFVRRYKVDELTQLWNVLVGDMSVVGPRPQVQVDVDRYTDAEREMLNVRPGITDIASIVFADEGDILHGADDPDLRYNQVIRPWKSRLALLYVGRTSLWIDLQLIALTVLTLISRDAALRRVAALVERIGGAPELVEVSRRRSALTPAPPPGALEVVPSL